MTTPLPGGIWYPERSTIVLPLGVSYVVIPATGDAAGALFSFGGDLVCDAAAFTVRFAPTGDFTIALTDTDGVVLRSTDWPGTRNPGGVNDWMAVYTPWEPITLTMNTSYRLICVRTGVGAVAVNDSLAGAYYDGADLGHRITRTSGVWTASPTRRMAAAIHIQAF